MANAQLAFRRGRDGWRDPSGSGALRVPGTNDAAKSVAMALSRFTTQPWFPLSDASPEPSRARAYAAEPTWRTGRNGLTRRDRHGHRRCICCSTPSQPDHRCLGGRRRGLDEIRWDSTGKSRSPDCPGWTLRGSCGRSIFVL